MKKLFLLFSFITCVFLFAQDSVTKNYLDTDTKAVAKDFSKKYNENVLAKKYTIRNLGNPESDNYDVEYTVSDAAGSAVTIVNYDFRLSDFTLTLKSMKYISKINGKEILITSNDPREVAADYYQRIKKLLITLQSGYISPDLNK